jgi:hypothetical protein
MSHLYLVSKRLEILDKHAKERNKQLALFDNGGGFRHGPFGATLTQMGTHAAADSGDSDQADSDAEMSEGDEGSEAEGSDDDASEGTDSGDEDARTSKVGDCWMAGRAGGKCVQRCICPTLVDRRPWFLHLIIV